MAGRICPRCLWHLERGRSMFDARPMGDPERPWWHVDPAYAVGATLIRMVVIALGVVGHKVLAP